MEDITPEKANTVADVQERKEVLTKILRHSQAYPALIKTGHVISAIDTLNRMDGLYSVPFGFEANKVIHLICDEKTVELIADSAERTRLLLPAGRPETDSPADSVAEKSQKEAISGS